VRRVR